MGTVQAIYIAETEGAPMYPIKSARLIAGLGIEGDRYAAQAGTFSHNPGDHELTFIEAEVLEAIEAEHNLHLEETASRRNIITQGVRLNELVGQRFWVGSALCEGTRLCEPCAHLEKTTGVGGLVRLMVGRGGLRAVILETGTAKPGDAIEPVTTL
jgi:MOSC domain-containing protein YiiM